MLRMGLYGLIMLGTCAQLAADDVPHFNRRNDFRNSRLEFEREGHGHVAFIGGSITEMDGYRQMVCADLQERFPECEFDFTDAGIASTCSTTGAFRLQRDVLAHGPVDLFFIEFAVNDDQDAAHTRQECIRGMEGMLRHALAHNPQMDIVITYFVNPEMLETLHAGGTPLTIEAHETVAQHYGVTTVNLAAEVAKQISAGELTWDQYGGTHPAPRGNRICADMIRTLLNEAWGEPGSDEEKPAPHDVPAKPIDPHSYVNGRFISAESIHPGAGWRHEIPDWAMLPGQCRGRFLDLELYVADEPGAELSIDFTGTAIGAYVLAGPDAGRIDVSVDGEPFEEVELYHRFSKGLHYPRTVMFDAELKPGEHSVRVRVAGTRHELSSGQAVRVLEFVGN
ncbi:MAG: SGNH/GDSL hydrolase family protein [Planctomycetota bacterium]|nr:MAG: SGNH/GDSL hydrolase family protein [Planctomycetota bacterium]REJ90807.1 MAG: SGNH/GDSL hydrolase family protein [Planctomycetota bacterium]REK24279.1 MAG: SGNH/GDSL hydrolase family protein [Planctomycetota bacterium]REK28736.1 MAG: SGNH/GDSL hydrolase family protein [Planctomycetota bacterium]